MIIRQKSYPRAGLVGNPSDGYFGKTIAFAFTNFCAEVVLYETPELEILPNTRDHSRFSSLTALVEDVQLFGYYGGIRLLKAAVKRFHDYCCQEGIDLHERNFTLRYDSNIPHLVGLAGSSAIITACIRAMMAFYGITIPKPHLANLALSVETDELQISAGLQDRVAQAYQGLVYMDFNETTMAKQGYGDYVELDPKLLPPLYIAYRTELAEVSGVFHSGLRHRYLDKDPDVLAAIEAWGNMTDSVRSALTAGDGKQVGEYLDRNFDTRVALGGVNDGNRELVRIARSVGASAKLTGSGGAIIGTVSDEAMFTRLREACEPHNIDVIEPAFASAIGDPGI
ncbi:MAG: GHMP kinase [Verrucomicrobia bacterium]|jgi:glucuronokinase|nr:GHMP kinase [Verrucomicrobiota bacterium]